jgi:hypothetical protein
MLLRGQAANGLHNDSSIDTDATASTGRPIVAVCFGAKNSNGMYQYYSSDHSTAAQRPKLTIVFQ